MADHISQGTGVAVVSILVLVFSFPAIVLSAFRQIFLPSTEFGPESLAFESPGGAFYTGVSDGHILRYQPPIGFSAFAITSPNRSATVCDGTTDPDKGPICGRPLGLAFNPFTRLLYIADAYYGLLVADSNGRLARQLATSAEGQRFVATNAVDIDPTTGIVYFTDASAVYDLRNASTAALSNDSTGRLMNYNPYTDQVTVLLRNLSGAVGVAVSGDGSFLLVSEFIGNRIQRFWLRGPRANTAEMFISSINNIARPNNIKRNAVGQFWIAAGTSVAQAAQTSVPMRVRADAYGRILETVSLEAQYGNTAISEVQESGFALYVSSRNLSFIGVYSA